MILRKGGRRVAKQGEVFQRRCRWFGLLFIRDCKRTFGVIISIMAATTTLLCGNWLSSPLLRLFSHSRHVYLLEVYDAAGFPDFIPAVLCVVYALEWLG